MKQRHQLILVIGTCYVQAVFSSGVEVRYYCARMAREGISFAIMHFGIASLLLERYGVTIRNCREKTYLGMYHDAQREREREREKLMMMMIFYYSRIKM